MVLPFPRLIATCATGGSPPRPGCGSLAKWKSNAPGVCSACCTVMVAPCSLSQTYWCAAPSGTVTPDRAAAHFVSSEQSNDAGLGSVGDVDEPHTYGLPFCSSAVVTNCWVVAFGTAPPVGTALPTPVDPVRLEMSDEMSGEVLVPVLAPVPVRLDTSPESSPELLDPLAPPAEPSVLPMPAAVCVFIASVSSDAKSAPVPAPDAALVAPVVGDSAALTCCWISWIRAWTATMPSRAMRV